MLAKSKVISFAICAMLFAVSCRAEAQQPKKIPRIGFLSGSSPSTISARVEAFRQGLRELGYVETKNVLIDYRYAEGKNDRLLALASELVRINRRRLSDQREGHGTYHSVMFACLPIYGDAPQSSRQNYKRHQSRRFAIRAAEKV